METDIICNKRKKATPFADIVLFCIDVMMLSHHASVQREDRFPTTRILPWLVAKTLKISAELKQQPPNPRVFLGLFFLLFYFGAHLLPKLG